MEGYEGFSEDMNEMFENSNHPQRKQEFFKANAVALGLDKVESCIGVLPDGVVDAYLVKECMPNLRQYYGQVALEDERIGLEREMGALDLPSLEVKIYPEPSETWQGPGVQVDAVIAIQCLQFIKGRQSFLKKCIEWLKPGGILIVVFCSPDSFFTKATLEFAPDAPLAIHSDIGRDDLRAVGIQDPKEYSFPMETWVENGKAGFAAFTLDRKVTDEEVEAFYKFRQEHFPAKAIVTNNVVFHWRKKT